MRPQNANSPKRNPHKQLDLDSLTYEDNNQHQAISLGELRKEYQTFARHMVPLGMK